MTTTLAVALPWGRLHATPWDRHVNEAAVEWPPSPWRLLRALYATWRRRADWLDQETVTSLLDRLAAPPAFLLPPATEAHTRHYLPDWTSGPPKWNPQTKRYDLRRTDKVIDAFAVTERGAELWVRWDLDLPANDREALEVLAARLGYLGRAESLCEACVLSGDSARPPSLRAATWLRPLEEVAAGLPDVATSTRVLCPAEPLDLDALLVDTPTMRKARLLQPEGSRWVRYAAPAPAASAVEAPRRLARQVRQPVAVRWAISAPARPAVTAAVTMSDALRSACQSCFGKQNEGRSSVVLSGKAPDGSPLRGHEHAHYLADDEDNDGLLDTLIVWARGGLGSAELQALASCTTIAGYRFLSEKDFRPCRLGLEAVGDIREVSSRLVGPSTTWTSYTPFAPTRHQKRRQDTEAYVDQQIRLELERRGLAAPESVEVTPAPAGRQPLEFRRYRINERINDSRRAFHVRIAFAERVDGPMVLGALSHFGLGLFVPDV